jgi:hypothetical protein
VFEYFGCSRIFEVRLAIITTEGNEVEVSTILIALQMLGHDGRVYIPSHISRQTAPGDMGHPLRC